MAAPTWTKDDDANLRALWDEGHAASYIGSELGRTRNAVLGRIHRLGISQRRETKKPLLIATAPRSRTCQWPMWPHDSAPTHEFCGKAAAIGSSYCETHRARSIRKDNSMEGVVRYDQRAKAGKYSRMFMADDR